METLEEQFLEMLMEGYSEYLKATCVRVCVRVCVFVCLYHLKCLYPQPSPTGLFNVQLMHIYTVTSIHR